MIEMGKKYQTRDGRAVRILCTDLKGCGCATVIGLVTQESGTEYVESWMADGSILPATQPSRNGKTACDLVPVPTKHEGWGLVDMEAPSYATRDEAERAFKSNVYAVWDPNDGRYQIKHVTWES